MDERVECKLGNTTFPSSELTINGVFNLFSDTQRTGICNECKRNWNLWRPGATSVANLKIKVEKSQVTECVRVNTD